MHNMLSWKATVLQQHAAGYTVSVVYGSLGGRELGRTNLIVTLITRWTGPEIRDLIYMKVEIGN